MKTRGNHSDTVKKQANISKNTAMISVIMCTYNEPAEYIEKSIRSILRQTYPDFELIVVVDSSDNISGLNIIKKIASGDKRIRIIVNNKNIGLTASLNKAVADAKGKYIARIDADDIAFDDRLESQLAFLEKNNLDLVGCNIERIDMDGNTIENGVTNLPTDDRNIKKFLKSNSPIYHPTWFAKAELLKNNPYIDFPACEDYELLTRLAKNGARFGNVKQVKLHYRVNKDGISLTKEAQQKLGAYYISSKFRKKENCSLEGYRDYINSDAGIKRKKSIDKYYSIVNKIKDRKENKRRLSVLLHSCCLLVVSAEAKRKIFDKIKKRIMALSY